MANRYGDSTKLSVQLKHGFTACTADDVRNMLRIYFQPKLPVYMTVEHVAFRVKEPKLWRWLVRLALWILRKDGYNIVEYKKKNK
jgi:hypothetical protein